jgi:hypothetical protein
LTIHFRWKVRRHRSRTGARQSFKPAAGASERGRSQYPQAAVVPIWLAVESPSHPEGTVPHPGAIRRQGSPKSCFVRSRTRLGEGVFIRPARCFRFLSGYSESRVAIPRGHIAQVGVTGRERRPYPNLNGAHQLWIRSSYKARVYAGNSL